MPKISEERRAERRDSIIQAARECFARKGLHTTTMDDIIRQSGLSAGAVYGYFTSKEQLIFAALTPAMAGLAQRKAMPGEAVMASVRADLAGACLVESGEAGLVEATAALSSLTRRKAGLARRKAMPGKAIMFSARAGLARSSKVSPRRGSPCRIQ